MAKTDPHARVTHEANLRFYAELNDFLPAGRCQRDFCYRFTGTPSVKDTIEALGVPHTEVDVILVDGKSVDFAHRLRGGERVAVYPMFERYVVSPVTRLRRHRCGRTYWRGSHLKRLDRIVERAKASGRRDLPDENRTRRGYRVRG